MYEFKITVEIPGLAEAIGSLATALSSGQVHTICNQHGNNNHQIENVGTLNMGVSGTTKNPTTAREVPMPTPENTPNATPATTPATVEPPQPVNQSKSYTVDDLSRAGAALIDQGKMTQLIDLLKKFGVQAVTQLKEGQYPAFVEDLKALGAAL